MPSITHDIRHHHRIPPTLPTPARRIFIKHPGYSPSPDLLWLYAYDKVPGTELWGCSHRIALDACRIITNNRDGFLSTTPQRQDKIPDNDLTLTADVYYYFIAAPDEPDYPVVANFTAWRFPEILPEHWRLQTGCMHTDALPRCKEGILCCTEQLSAHRSKHQDKRKIELR